MDSNNPTTDLLNILSKAMDSNMYGSVEVYIEDGQITQITQRIIKKIKKAKPHSGRIQNDHGRMGSKDNQVNVKFPG